MALLKALDLIDEKHAGTTNETPLIRSDSTLIVNQVKGKFQVKEARLKELNEKARKAMQKLGMVRLEWVPRRENYAGLWIEGMLRPLRVHRLPG